jgi:ribosome maturation factor RimP
LAETVSPAVAGVVVKLDPRVQELAERIVTREGLELVHVELAGGRSPILRVYIDKPGGVTVDDCAAISERLSVHLDVEDFIPSQYVLEVASPGLDRGLYKAADYERFAGLPAHVKLSEPLNGQRNFHGTLIGLDKEGELTALLEDETGQQHRLPLAKILKANVEIEP